MTARALIDAVLLDACEQVCAGKLPAWRGALRIARAAQEAGVHEEEPFRTFVALDEAWNADFSAHARLTEAILEAAREVLARH
jgi:hypothetical protein